MQAAHIPSLSDAIATLFSARAELVEQIKEMDRRLHVVASQSQACEIPGRRLEASRVFRRQFQLSHAAISRFSRSA